MESKQSTFNVLFYIKKTRLLKNGEAPIAMRISVKGQVGEILIKRSIPVPLWNQDKECSRGKDHAAKELNHYVDTTRVRIFQIRRELEEAGKDVNLDSVRDRYYGRDAETVQKSLTICGIYQKHNDDCRALTGNEFQESTVKKFDTSLKALREYIKKRYKVNDLPLSEINGDFVRGLDFYLKTERKCVQNSAVKHLKNLKKVVRIALANEWIQKDPFAGIVFRHDEVNVEFLTEEELQTLIAKEFTIDRLTQIRDIFVFCCFTGFAFIDVKQLKPEHIVTDNKGAKWIRINRQKTGTMCNVPLIKPAIELIEKYSDHPVCMEKGVLLPVPSNQKMNGYLKEIADLCRINKKLKTHVARHIKLDN